MAVPPGLPPIDQSVIAAAKAEARAKMAGANTITVSVTINAKVYDVHWENLGGLDDHAKGAYIDGTLQKILDIARTEKLGEPNAAKQNKTVSMLKLTSNNTIEKEITKAGQKITKVYQLTDPAAASTAIQKYIKLEGDKITPKRQKIFELLSNINTVYDSMVNRHPNTSVEVGQAPPAGGDSEVRLDRRRAQPPPSNQGGPNKANTNKQPVVEDLDEDENVELEEDDDDDDMSVGSDNDWLLENEKKVDPKEKKKTIGDTLKNAGERLGNIFKRDKSEENK